MPISLPCKYKDDVNELVYQQRTMILGLPYHTIKEIQSLLQLGAEFLGASHATLHTYRAMM